MSGGTEAEFGWDWTLTRKVTRLGSIFGSLESPGRTQLTHDVHGGGGVVEGLLGVGGLDLVETVGLEDFEAGLGYDNRATVPPRVGVAMGTLEHCRQRRDILLHLLYTFNKDDFN